MAIEFVCKKCSKGRTRIPASFSLKLSAEYSDPGSGYRQSNLCIIDYDVDEHLVGAIVACPSCNLTGALEDVFDTVRRCVNCERVIDEDGGGYCAYNGYLFCNGCFSNQILDCRNCGARDACEIFLRDSGKLKKGESKPKRRRRHIDLPDVSDMLNLSSRQSTSTLPGGVGWRSRTSADSPDEESIGYVRMIVEPTEEMEESDDDE